MEQTKQTEQWNNGTNETTRQVTKRYKLNYVSPGVGGRRKPVNPPHPKGVERLRLDYD